jgi:hypothetical protein
MVSSPDTFVDAVIPVPRIGVKPFGKKLAIVGVTRK